MKRILKAALLFFGCLVCAQIVLIHEFRVGVFSARGLAVALVVVVLTGFILAAFILLSFMKKKVTESLRNEAILVTKEEGVVGGSHTFVNVWYSPRKKWYDLHLLAYRDVGRLTINETSIVFEGRNQELVLENIRRVSFGKQGRDFVNNWISINYGNGALASAALFADGNMHGWSGVLGGTERIFEAVKQLAPQ